MDDEIKKMVIVGLAIAVVGVIISFMFYIGLAAGIMWLVREFFLGG